ncbi:MAG: DUF2059 domain-containing protein [Rubrivivax sp.]
MRKLIALLALAGCSIAAAAAPPSDESILALFKVMKAESLLDSVYATLEPAMKQAMQQAAAGKTLSAEQQKILDLAPQRLGQVLRAELSWDKLLPMQLAIYRESFEQAEIDGLTEFYKSPLGQSFVSKMPAVTQKAMMATQGHMQQVIPKLKAAMDELLAEAKLGATK